MYWLWWSLTNPSVPLHIDHCAILQLWRETNVWRNHKKSLRHTTDVPFAYIRRLWGFQRGFHVASRVTQNTTLQWTYIPREMKPCLNAKDCHTFSLISLLCKFGKGRIISTTSYHIYNNISTLVLSMTAGTAVSYHFCWSNLCREAKGRVGCGRLNCLNLSSAWGYSPGMNINILERFIAV